MTALLLVHLLACAETTTLSDAENYSFSSSLTAESAEFASQTDLRVDWSALGVDLQGSTIDPTTEVDLVSIVILELGEQEALDAFVDDALYQSQVGAYATFEPPDGTTSGLLSEFDFLGTPVVPEEHVTEGQGSWLITLNTDGVPGTRMMRFFQPVDDGPVADITLDDDSADLDYVVDLSAGQPLQIVGDRLEWSGLTTDMRGLPIRLSELDRVTIGHYDESLAELEGDFLQLEAMAEESWDADFQAQIELELSELVDADGAPFPGVGRDGTWLLALRCMTCANPAPPFMAVLTR
ncbi:MAG: hypothetical protein H6741_04130 [Alphaproteobacteria bacterium]|nr:hypothetical protein [Alphaproteobacteria bacterium]